MIWELISRASKHFHNFCFLLKKKPAQSVELPSYIVNRVRADSIYIYEYLLTGFGKLYGSQDNANMLLVLLMGQLPYPFQKLVNAIYRLFLRFKN